MEWQIKKNNNSKMNMDIQQQNYFFVNAIQRWYIFFIKSIITHVIEITTLLFTYFAYIFSAINFQFYSM